MSEALDEARCLGTCRRPQQVTSLERSARTHIKASDPRWSGCSASEASDLAADRRQRRLRVGLVARCHHHVAAPAGEFLATSRLSLPLASVTTATLRD